MDWIKDVMSRRLSILHRGKNMIGSIALNEIKSYLDIRKIDSEIEDEIMTWYVKYDKLFIKTINQKLKIQIFKEKLNIIKVINQRLSKIGYKLEIKDIILK